LWQTLDDVIAGTNVGAQLRVGSEFIINRRADLLALTK